MAATDPPSSPPMTPEQRRELDDRLGRLVGGVNRFYIGPDWHLLWTEVRDGNATMMQWHPETPDELAAAARFYDAAHGLGEFARAVRPGGPFARPADELALAAAVVADRDDDLRYLVYADYLTERGDSQGDFIRASVRRHRLPADDPARPGLDRACDALIEAGAEDWFRPLTELGVRPEFRRMGLAGQFLPALWLGPQGVIDSFTVDRPGLLPGAADRLFAAAPFLRKLSVEFGHLDPAGLAAVPQLAQIDELDLGNTALTAGGLAVLAGSAFLTRLGTLNVGSNEVGDAGVSALARSPLLARLVALDVSGCGVTDDGARDLAGRPAAARLRSLSVGMNPLTAAGLSALCASPHLAGVTRLTLRGVALDDAGADAVAAAGFAAGLTALGLGAVPEAGPVARLLRAARFPALTTLDLSSVPLGVAGAAALAASGLRETVRELTLDSAGLEDAGLAALAGGRFPALTTLDLSRNRVGAGGLAAVAAAGPFPALRVLRLWDNLADAAAVAVIAGSAAFAHLAHLTLTGNAVGPDGAAALAGSAHLGNLVRLEVDAAAVGDAGRAALVARFGEDAVSLV